MGQERNQAHCLCIFDQQGDDNKNKCRLFTFACSFYCVCVCVRARARTRVCVLGVDNIVVFVLGGQHEHGFAAEL